MSLISSKAGDHCSYLNPGSVTVDGLPKKGLVALYSLAGQDPVLTPGARWYTPAVNHLLSSEDSRTASTPWNEIGSGSSDDATHFTFVAEDDVLYQNITLAAGLNVTLYARVRAVSGNVNLHFAHVGITPGTTAQTVTNTLADYAVTVVTDGGLISYGIRDENVAGHGQIEVTRWMVAVGTHTAAEMAAMYEKTTDRQSIYDFSGNDNHGIPGGVAAPTTNDPTLSWESRNLLAAGSAQNLTGWTNSGCVVTATTAEDDSAVAFESVLQVISATDATAYTRTTWVLKDAVVPATRFPLFRTTVSATYDVSLDTSSGATTENSALGGSHTVTSDGAYWRLEISFTTDDALGIELRVFPAAGANADLTTQSAAAVGTITVQKQQLEVGSTASTFTDSAESGSAVMGFTTDDYVTADGVASGFSGEDVPLTVVALIRADNLSGDLGIASFGNSTTNSHSYIYVRIFARTATTGDPQFVIEDTASGVQVSRESNGSVITVGKYYLVAFVTTGTTLNIYLDGTDLVLDSDDVDQGELTSLDRFTIGAVRRNTVINYWEGGIGPVAVYSRALSAGEVTQLTNVTAQRAWDYSGIVIPGSNVDYSVPPSQIDEP